MIKRILLIALTFLLLLTPSLVNADTNILGNPICHSERSEESRVPSPSLSLRVRVTNKQADNGISVLDSSVEIHFPSELVFHLEAESHANIVDARLHYQVDKMNYAQVTSEAWPDFAPATRIKTSWAWDMRKVSLPPGAAITYWWTIEDAEGKTNGTSPSVAHFDDPNYHWQALTDGGAPEESKTFQGEGGELNLFWYEGNGSFGQELMDACQEGLARLTRNLGTYPEKPIKIYIYASAEDLRRAMVFPMEWSGGVAFTEFGIIAIGISPSKLDWGKRALVHELTHLVVHQAIFSPYGRLPTWLDEGLAMYNEGKLEPYLDSYLQKAISEDKLLSVRSLCSPFSAEPEKAYLSYAQSYSMVEYLLSNYGQDKMLSLLTLFKQGSTYDEALAEVYGFDIDGLDSRWGRSLISPAVTVSLRLQSHPALTAVLSALATSLVLAGALALEEWAWQRSGGKV